MDEHGLHDDILREFLFKDKKQPALDQATTLYDKYTEKAGRALELKILISASKGKDNG